MLEAIDHEIAKHAVLAMRRAAVIAKARAVRAIGETTPHVPVDLGEMRRSYMVIPLPNGARLENVAPHAAIQEYGTKPFSAPTAPLLAWAKRRARGTKGTAKALARKAWSSIKRFGIKPKGFHARASQDFAGITAKAMAHEMKKVRG